MINVEYTEVMVVAAGCYGGFRSQTSNCIEWGQHRFNRVIVIDVKGVLKWLHADQGEDKAYTVVTVSRVMQGIFPEPFFFLNFDI